MNQKVAAAPAGMRAVTKKSAIPVLAVGAVWLLWGLFLPLYRLFHYGLALAASALVFAVLDRCVPGKTVFEKIPDVHTGDALADTLLKDGRALLARVETAAAKLSVPEVRAQISRVLAAGDKILDLVEKRPKSAPSLRRFMNYYLPTLEKLVDTYALVEEQNLEGENITQSKERISAMLELLAAAFEKQLDALFGDTVLDVSSDISVMQTMMAQEGLATAQAEEAEENQIKLQF